MRRTTILETTTRILLISLAFLTTAACTLADDGDAVKPSTDQEAAAVRSDWPGWRGARRDAVSPDTGLLKTWPKEGPPLLWQATTAGIGYGSPSVADGKVFVMGNGPDREWVICYDEQTGKQLWACATGRVPFRGKGFAGPRSTPTYYEGRVYAIGISGWLVCINAETGKPIWFTEMQRRFGGRMPLWGYSESPLIDKGTLICTPGMANTVVAFDTKTAKKKWVAKLGDPASYSSPIVAEIGGTRMYIVFTEVGLVGLRASDGSLLWRYNSPSNGQANVATPVVVGSTVFAASGYGHGGGCAWIKKDAEGKFIPKELYFTNKMQNMHGGFLVFDGNLYGCSDPGVLVCMNYKTGKVSKVLRTGRFSVAAAEGLLYLRNENGKMSLYDVSPTKFTKRGEFTPKNHTEEKAWPHPVIARGKLFLRDQHYLSCYDLSAEKKEEPKAAAEPAPKPEKPATPPRTASPKPPARPATVRPATTPKPTPKPKAPGVPAFRERRP